MRSTFAKSVRAVCACLVLAASVPAARAQEAGGAPAFEARNTVGIESEQYLFEELGRAYPQGALSFSCVRSQIAGEVLYDIAAHRNHASQGPSESLGRVTAHYTVATPNYARAGMASCESAFDLTAGRSCAVVAGRFAGENGPIPVVMIVMTTIPAAASGYLPLSIVSIMSTSQTLGQAAADAITLAQKLESDAAIEWTHANLPATALDPFNPDNQPVPPVVPRPPQEFRIQWLYPAGHQPPPLVLSCWQGFNHPNNVFGDPAKALMVLANPAYSAGVVIRCTACEPPRSNLCVTGDPAWSVRLVENKVARVGNFYFKAAIDSTHPSHESYDPPGPVGDVWHIDVMWSIEYREAFPIKAPFWDPGPMPPTVHWTKIYKCSNTVACLPN